MNLRCPPPLSKSLTRIIDNPAKTASIISVVLLIYQAFLPRGLIFEINGQAGWWQIIPPPDNHFSKMDIIGNIIPYCIFTNLVYLALRRKCYTFPKAYALSLISVIAMAIAVESIEYFNPGRNSSCWDVLSSAVGGAICILTGPLVEGLLTWIVQPWVTRQISKDPMLVAAAILIGVIFFDAATPFHVISDMEYLKDNIKHSTLIPFTTPNANISTQINWIENGSMNNYMAPEWSADNWGSFAERFLTYSSLLGILIYRKDFHKTLESIILWCAILCITELISLGIVGGHINVNHIVAGLIGLPFAILAAGWSKKYPRLGLKILIIAFFSEVIISDLRPFQLEPMKQITIDMFIPLIYHFENPDILMLSNVIQSVLDYAPAGFVVYLFNVSSHDIMQRADWPSAAPAILACALSGAMTETLQLWIPTRTPCLEDVIYAAMGGLTGVALARIFIHITAQTQTQYLVDSNQC